MQEKIKGIPYKMPIELLMYATMNTKVNLAFTVSTINQFIFRVGPPHWMARKCTIRYLEGTLDFKKCLGGKDTALK